jgi:hypothetical protein
MAKSGTTQETEGEALEALELVRDLSNTFQARNELYAYTERVLYMDEPVYIPPKYKESTVEVRTPLALHAVNTVTAALSANPPQTQFDPVSVGDTGQQNSTKREHFFDASWEQQQRQGGRRIFRPFMHSLVGKGEAVIKTLEIRKRAWASYDEQAKTLKDQLTKQYGKNLDQRDQEWDRKTEEIKRGLSYPIMTTDIPAENFMYIRGESGFTTCVETKVVPYFETLQKYQYGLNSKGQVVEAAAGLPQSDWTKVMTQRQTRTLRMVEIWTADGKAKYLLLGPGDSLDKRQGKIVKTITHDYVNPDTLSLIGPYFHCFGITTSSRNLETMGVSIIFGFLRLYGLLNSLLTMQQQAAFRYAFTAYKRKQQTGYGMPDNLLGLGPSPAQNAQQIIDIQPGDIIDWDIDPIELGHSGVDLDKAIALVRQLLDLALPEVVQGVMGGDSSGYAVAQAAHLARLIWDPIVDNAELCFAERVGFESWLIEHCIKEPVYVFGDLPVVGKGKPGRGVFSVGPDDLKHYHRYNIRLEPETPSNEVIKLRAIAEALQLKIMSPQQAIVESGRNVDEVERDWLLWDAKQDPRVKAVLMNRAFAKLDMADQQAMGGAMAEFGGPPPGGDPAAALGGVGAVAQPGQAGMPLIPNGGGMPVGAAPPSLPGPGQGSIGPTPVVPTGGPGPGGA